MTEQEGELRATSQQQIPGISLPECV